MIAFTWTRRAPGFTGADGLATLGLAAVAVALVWPSAPLLHGLAPPCPFLRITGLPCGTCGFTRAFVRAAHLEVAGAFAVSPLGASLFYAWAILSAWRAVAWLAPRWRLPAVRADSLAGRRLVRFGLPLAFLLNWGYLIAWTLAVGAPPA